MEAFWPQGLPATAHLSSYLVKLKKHHNHSPPHTHNSSFSSDSQSQTSLWTAASLPLSCYPGASCPFYDCSSTWLPVVGEFALLPLYLVIKLTKETEIPMYWVCKTSQFRNIWLWFQCYKVGIRCPDPFLSQKETLRQWPNKAREWGQWVHMMDLSPLQTSLLLITWPQHSTFSSFQTLEYGTLMIKDLRKDFFS